MPRLTERLPQSHEDGLIEAMKSLPTLTIERTITHYADLIYRATSGMMKEPPSDDVIDGMKGMIEVMQHELTIRAGGAA